MVSQRQSFLGHAIHRSFQGCPDLRPQASKTVVQWQGSRRVSQDVFAQWCRVCAEGNRSLISSVCLPVGRKYCWQTLSTMAHQNHLYDSLSFRAAIVSRPHPTSVFERNPQFSYEQVIRLFGGGYRAPERVYGS